MMSADLKRRLLFILHRGLVESRSLAQAGNTDQIRDLADVLEVIPSWMTDESTDAPTASEIKAELQRHEQRYPGSFNYSDFIDRYDAPRF